MFAAVQKEGWTLLNNSKGGEIGGNAQIWTMEACQKDAKKYKTKRDWRKSSGSAHHAAYRHGWVAKCCGHMILLERPKGYWTFERCKQIASKDKTVKDWSSHNSYAYAHRKKWAKEIIESLSLKKLARRDYWTKEKCIESASAYSSRSEWGEKRIIRVR
jgi:hypothetical protein